MQIHIPLKRPTTHRRKPFSINLNTWVFFTPELWIRLTLSAFNEQQIECLIVETFFLISR